MATVTQRSSAASAYPRISPARCEAAISSRRANPVSKSRATLKPVNTPLNAADCSRTKTKTNDV